MDNQKEGTTRKPPVVTDEYKILQVLKAIDEKLQIIIDQGPAR
uniref:Uncharacterized protein n=1 Tax=viral metagenome TaxID=1070528 RepID=A0A6M3KL20_9ZZZZ